jgi:hypothetical protein
MPRQQATPAAGSSVEFNSTIPVRANLIGAQPSAPEVSPLEQLAGLFLQGGETLTQLTAQEIQDRDYEEAKRRQRLADAEDFAAKTNAQLLNDYQEDEAVSARLAEENQDPTLLRAFYERHKDSPSQELKTRANVGLTGVLSRENEARELLLKKRESEQEKAEREHEMFASSVTEVAEKLTRSHAVGLDAPHAPKGIDANDITSLRDYYSLMLVRNLQANEADNGRGPIPLGDDNLPTDPVLAKQITSRARALATDQYTHLYKQFVKDRENSVGEATRTLMFNTTGPLADRVDTAITNAVTNLPAGADREKAIETIIDSAGASITKGVVEKRLGVMEALAEVRTTQAKLDSMGLGEFTSRLGDKTKIIADEMKLGVKGEALRDPAVADTTVPGYFLFVRSSESVAYPPIDEIQIRQLRTILGDRADAVIGSAGSVLEIPTDSLDQDTRLVVDAMVDARNELRGTAGNIAGFKPEEVTGTPKDAVRAYRNGFPVNASFRNEAWKGGFSETLEAGSITEDDLAILVARHNAENPDGPITQEQAREMAAKRETAGPLMVAAARADTEIIRRNGIVPTASMSKLGDILLNGRDEQSIAWAEEFVRGLGGPGSTLFLNNISSGTQEEQVDQIALAYTLTGLTEIPNGTDRQARLDAYKKFRESIRSFDTETGGPNDTTALRKILGTETFAKMDDKVLKILNTLDIVPGADRKQILAMPTQQKMALLQAALGYASVYGEKIKGNEESVWAGVLGMFRASGVQFVADSNSVKMIHDPLKHYVLPKDADSQIQREMSRAVGPVTGADAQQMIAYWGLDPRIPKDDWSVWDYTRAGLRASGRAIGNTDLGDVSFALEYTGDTAERTSSADFHGTLDGTLEGTFLAGGFPIVLKGEGLPTEGIMLKGSGSRSPLQFSSKFLKRPGARYNRITSKRDPKLTPSQPRDVPEYLRSASKNWTPEQWETFRNAVR